MARTYELADVMRKHLQEVDKGSMPMDHYKIIDAISKCRTSALGGHVDGCDSCGHIRISYNSCRNRHCPKCQGLKKEAWIVMQEDMLLEVVYFHVVFTLPHEFNKLCMYNPREMYNLLFKAAWHVLSTLGKDPQWIGAKMSATMLLHSWSQTLQLHPHVHCIVPNGGLDKQGSWRFPKKGNNNFLFPVLAMNKLFKGFFMDKLLCAIKSKALTIPQHYYAENGGTYAKWKDKLYEKEWVVFTKKPFSGVQHVIDYLGRYSHKVAITNYRIKGIDDQHKTVSFEYKDYRDGAKKKMMTLSISEFVRRFQLHILPKNFRKVRQYGLSSNAAKKKALAEARIALGQKQQILLDRAERKKLAAKRLKINFTSCPKCKKGKMKMIITITSGRAPPTIKI